jgi:hypothetical protein
VAPTIARNHHIHFRLLSVFFILGSFIWASGPDF